MAVTRLTGVGGESKVRERSVGPRISYLTSSLKGGVLPYGFSLLRSSLRIKTKMGGGGMWRRSFQRINIVGEN